MALAAFLAVLLLLTALARAVRACGRALCRGARLVMAACGWELRTKEGRAAPPPPGQVCACPRVRRNRTAWAPDPGGGRRTAPPGVRGARRAAGAWCRALAYGVIAGFAVFGNHEESSHDTGASLVRDKGFHLGTTGSDIERYHSGTNAVGYIVGGLGTTDRAQDILHLGKMAGTDGGFHTGSKCLQSHILATGTEDSACERYGTGNIGIRSANFCMEERPPCGKGGVPCTASEAACMHSLSAASALSARQQISLRAVAKGRMAALPQGEASEVCFSLPAPPPVSTVGPPTWRQGFAFQLGTASFRFGEALKPGPQRITQRGIMSINVTALMGAREVLQGFASSVFLVQEHSVPASSIESSKLALKAKGMAAILSPTDPEAGGATGGVAIIAKRPCVIQPCTPNTTAFEQACQLGRCIMGMVSVGPNVTVACISAYGWASKSSEHSKFARTDALLAAIDGELAHWPDMPVIIRADLNARVEHLPTLARRVQAAQWHDLGSKAEAWGSPPSQPTCWAHNAKSPTRADYLIVNNHALSLVQGFEYHGWGYFDVHSPISAVLSTSTPEPVDQWVLPGCVELGDVQESRIQTSIDIQYVEHEHELENSLARGDLTAFFQTWSMCFEQGLKSISPRPHGTGRGQPRVERASPPWARAAQAPCDGDTWFDESRPQLSGGALIMRRRFIHLAALAAKAKHPPVEPWGQELLRVCHAIRRATAHLPDEAPRPPQISPGGDGWHRVVLASKLYARDLDGFARKQAARTRAQRRHELSEKLNSPEGTSCIYRLLSPPPWTVGFFLSWGPMAPLLSHRP